MMLKFNIEKHEIRAIVVKFAQGYGFQDYIILEMIQFIQNEGENIS